MPGNTLNTGAMQLQEALRALEAAWEKAQDEWNDDVSRNFEEQHLQPVLSKLKAAVEGIHRFGQIVEAAQRDCDDWPTD